MHRITIRLIALGLYAAVTALLGALIVGPWLHALPVDTLGLWGIGTLVVFAAGAFTTALMTMAGIIGIGIAILLFVIAGNPSAGGAYGWPLLPPFWAAIGPWLPPGAGTDVVRGAAYFGNAGITRDLLVLGGYAAAGVVFSYASLMLLGRGHRKRRGRGSGRPTNEAGGRDFAGVHDAAGHDAAGVRGTPGTSGEASTTDTPGTSGEAGSSGVGNASGTPGTTGKPGTNGVAGTREVPDDRGVANANAGSDAVSGPDASGVPDADVSRPPGGSAVEGHDRGPSAETTT